MCTIVTFDDTPPDRSQWENRYTQPSYKVVVIMCTIVNFYDTLPDRSQWKNYDT